MSRRWAALLVLVIAGCGGDGGTGALPTTPTTSPVATPTLAAAQPGAVGLLASCTDDSEDSSGAVDLTAVAAERAADGSLLFIYKFSGDIPQSGTVLFSTVAAKRQYAYGIQDGQKNAHAVIDFNSGVSGAQPMPVSGVENIGPGEVQFGFPEGDVTKEQGGTAGITLDGEIVDTCTLG